MTHNLKPVSLEFLMHEDFEQFQNSLNYVRRENFARPNKMKENDFKFKNENLNYIFNELHNCHWIEEIQKKVLCNVQFCKDFIQILRNNDHTYFSKGYADQFPNLILNEVKKQAWNFRQ